MKALTLSELLRRGNAHQFVFGFGCREIFSAFLLFFRLLMSLPPPLRRSQGVERPAAKNFSSRPGTLSDRRGYSVFVSKDLSDIWEAERR